MKVMSINCNSLISDKRHALFSNLLLDHKPEILCICESKLDNTISDSAILPENSGYEIVNRKDNKFGAGGVLIALRSDLIVTPLKELDTSCEVVWIKLEINKSKPLYIGSFYRTPSKDINKLHESISNLTCKDTVLPNNNNW
jgi:exonuclease III